MKVIVFGATGGTGRLLMSGALAAGHSVTAFVRDRSVLEPTARLSVVKGDVFDGAAVEHAVAGHDAVLSALGGKPFQSLSICARAMSHIIPAMERLGVRRLVCISTFGAGDTRADVGWFAERVLFGFVLRGEIADKEAMERLLEQSSLEWTAVRINRLTDGPVGGQLRVADDRSIKGMRSVARTDVAAFMIEQLASDAWIRRKPVIQGV